MFAQFRNDFFFPIIILLFLFYTFPHKYETHLVHMMLCPMHTTNTHLHAPIDMRMDTEPARFETASRNVSTRRNDPITLSCLAKGDEHINIIWLHNNNRIDLNNYR